MKLEEKQDGLEKMKHIFYTLLNARTIQGWLIKMMLSLKMCYLGSLLSSLCSLLQRVPGPFAERPPPLPPFCLSVSLSHCLYPIKAKCQK